MVYKDKTDLLDKILIYSQIKYAEIAYFIFNLERNEQFIHISQQTLSKTYPNCDSLQHAHSPRKKLPHDVSQNANI